MTEIYSLIAELKSRGISFLVSNQRVPQSILTDPLLPEILTNFKNQTKINKIRFIWDKNRPNWIKNGGGVWQKENWLICNFYFIPIPTIKNLEEQLNNFVKSSGTKREEAKKETEKPEVPQKLLVQQIRQETASQKPEESNIPEVLQKAIFVQRAVQQAQQNFFLEKLRVGLSVRILKDPRFEIFNNEKKHWIEIERQDGEIFHVSLGITDRNEVTVGSIDYQIKGNILVTKYQERPQKILLEKGKEEELIIDLLSLEKINKGLANFFAPPENL